MARAVACAVIGKGGRLGGRAIVAASPSGAKRASAPVAMALSLRRHQAIDADPARSGELDSEELHLAKRGGGRRRIAGDAARPGEDTVAVYSTIG